MAKTKAVRNDLFRYEIETLQDCPDCRAHPGAVHNTNCDVERCSACGGQRFSCCCGGKHDKSFARWTGIWPGYAEAMALGLPDGLNESLRTGLYKLFFIKPSA